MLFADLVCGIKKKKFTASEINDISIFLRRAFVRLDAWFKWFNTTQSGEHDKNFVNPTDWSHACLLSHKHMCLPVLTCQPHCLINNLMHKLLKCNLGRHFCQNSKLNSSNWKFIFYSQEKMWAPTFGMEEIMQPHVNWIQRCSSTTYIYVLGLVEICFLRLFSTWSIISNHSFLISVVDTFTMPINLVSFGRIVDFSLNITSR